MKACILFAQPGEQSFHHEILHRVERALNQADISYTVRDLYKMNFQPVLSAADMKGVEQGRVSADIEEEQQLVTDADLLVMVYPVWWWSQPAVLKGWIDRVFTHGFAFRYEAHGPVGLLTEKRAIVFTTTHESEEEIRARGFDDLITKQIADGILSFVGCEDVVHRNFAAVSSASDQQRNQMLDEVETIVSRAVQPVTV
ncbi:NAD(P)H-dependent oxidoreductase [Brevibacillus sp. SYP-B805]|uniref:NAD(P)H-dependent oxidoreductase n=1 Tax=Brevibacillus sp. SYP-B805 TaxID=1578199 RepID=UPI0013ED1856|nr:NAD(P)H-dependent oxidoreductase [Brevibacillus sp. SYP-B805]NGQ97091.1 NAD(P)H-dependent oxidoreductase [Brevibacillus sp. SYP-B805]